MHNISPTVSFLLATLKFSLGTINKNELEEIDIKKVDWRVFNNLIQYHKVESLIHNKISESFGDYFPSNTTELLIHKHRINAAGNLLLSSEVIRISREFQTNQIPVLVIKGLAVSDWLYDNPGLRALGDIDLLVSSSNWESALSCMKTLGYEMSSIADRLVPGSQLSRQFIRTQKEVTFIHKSNNVMIELHWRFAPNHDVFPLDFDTVWNARSKFDIRGNSIQQLSNEMHAVYLCFHGSKHGWDKLFWLYDIALLMLCDEIDWNDVLQIAKEFKATVSLGLALILASRTFLVPIPEIINNQDDIIKVGGQLSDEILYKILTDTPIETSSGMLSMCKGVSWRSRISPVDAPFLSEWIHFLTSPSVHDWESVKLPDYLTSLYRVLRPFRLIGKGLFGSKQ